MSPNFHQLSGRVIRQIKIHFKPLDGIFYIVFIFITKFLLEVGEKWVSILQNILKMAILSSNFHQLPGEVRTSDMHFEALDKFFQVHIYSIPKFLAELGEKRA